MSVDDVVKWVPILVPSAGAIIGGAGLFINACSFIKSRKLEEIRLAESIFKDIRDFEDRIDNIDDKEEKLEWGRKFFNVIEWLSFLINNNHINDEKLVDYFKDDIKVWHKEWFTYDYLEKRFRDDKNTYEEFRKLYSRFKKEEQWNDCKCSDCLEEDNILSDAFLQKFRKTNPP